MPSKTIQIKSKIAGVWNSLYPVSLTSAIFDSTTGEKNLNTLLSEINDEFRYQLSAVQFADLPTAIAQLNSGTIKKLYIPDGSYSISDGLTISADNVTVEMSPNAKIVQTVSNKNAFIVSGKGVTIKGGTIEYPATFNGENRAWYDYEAVILVTGNDFTLDNVTLNNIYKIGVGVRDANDCIIRNCRIYGNYPSESWTGSETVHYGLHLDPGATTPGGNFIVTGCIIKTCVQGVFIGNYGTGVGYGCNVSGNVFYHCHNHGIYANSGWGHTFNNNTFNACQLGIACNAKSATICNNTLYTPTTGNQYDCVGFSLRECENSVIMGNTFKGDVLNGTCVLDLNNINEDTTINNIVANNIIDITNGIAIGIRVGSSALTAVSYNNIIKGNIVKVRGRNYLGLICMYAKSGSSGKDNRIEDNVVVVLNALCYGIEVVRQTRCVIKGNTIKLEYNNASATTQSLIMLTTVLKSMYMQNTLVCENGYGSNVTLRGMVDVNDCSLNYASYNNIDFESTSLVSGTPFLLNNSINLTTTIVVNNMLNGVYTEVTWKP